MGSVSAKEARARQSAARAYWQQHLTSLPPKLSVPSLPPVSDERDGGELRRPLPLALVDQVFAPARWRQKTTEFSIYLDDPGAAARQAQAVSPRLFARHRNTTRTATGPSCRARWASSSINVMPISPAEMATDEASTRCSPACGATPDAGDSAQRRELRGHRAAGSPARRGRGVGLVQVMFDQTFHPGDASSSTASTRSSSLVPTALPSSISPSAAGSAVASRRSPSKLIGGRFAVASADRGASRSLSTLPCARVLGELRSARARCASSTTRPRPSSSAAVREPECALPGQLARRALRGRRARAHPSASRWSRWTASGSVARALDASAPTAWHRRSARPA